MTDPSTRERSAKSTARRMPHTGTVDLHDAVPRGAHAEAEVDIFWTVEDGFVEPSDGLEHVTEDHLAGPDAEVDVPESGAVGARRRLVCCSPTEAPGCLHGQRRGSAGTRLRGLPIEDRNGDGHALAEKRSDEAAQAVRRQLCVAVEKADDGR